MEEESPPCDFLMLVSNPIRAPSCPFVVPQKLNHCGPALLLAKSLRGHRPCASFSAARNMHEKTKPGRFADLREMLSWASEWRWPFRLAVFAQTISMMFGLLFPWLMGKLIDAAMPSVKSLPPGTWQPAINTVALVLLGTLAAQAALTFFYSAAFQTAGQCTVVALRKRLYGRLIALPMKFYGEHRVGELASRLGSDMTLLEDFFCGAIPQGIRQGMLLGGGLVAIFLTSPRLAGLMLLSFPVFIVLAVIFGRSVRKISRAAQDRLAEAATVVEETLQGIASVKAFGNEAFERARHASAMDGFLATILRGARKRAALIAFIILGIFGAIVLVMWYGARLMQAGELTHGDLTKFTLYTLFVGGGVSSIAEVISAMQKGIGASQRVRELLAEPVESSRASESAGTHSNAQREMTDVENGSARALTSAATVKLDDVHFLSCAASLWRRSPANASRSSARAARGRAPSSRCCSAFTNPTRAASSSAQKTPTRSTPPHSAPAWPSSRRRCCSSVAPSVRTSHTDAPARPTPKSATPRSVRTAPSSSRNSPRALRRSSATAA
jgi:ABC-type multidrug transport system fused ATPase/permease subunit